jgi:hypothetical protein
MTNTTNHAPAGIDLDNLEALARNRFNGGLSLSADEALALIALARRAAADAPAADERQMFEAWASRENAPFMVADLDRYKEGYVRVTTDMAWEAWKARAAHPIGQVSPAIDQADAPVVAADEETRQRMRDAVAGALTGLYYCGRVWSAWSVGTMSEDDFSPADEDDNIIENVTAAAIDALGRATAPAPVCHAPAPTAEMWALVRQISEGYLSADMPDRARAILAAPEAAHAQQDAAPLGYLTPHALAELKAHRIGMPSNIWPNADEIAGATIPVYAASAAVSPSDATGAQAIKFALELAENENDDAAVSFLKAWNTEDAGYLKANWPDFDAATRDAERRTTAGEGEVRPLVEVLAALEELSRGAEIAKSDEWVNQRASVLLAALAPRHSLATSATGKADAASAGGLLAELSKAFVTLESNGGEGRTIVLKFNQREDAYAVHDFLLKGGGQEYTYGATSAADATDAARLDWLEQNHAQTYRFESTGDWRISDVWAPLAQEKTLREAIDAAMAASRQGDEA